jgi:integrase
VTGITCRGPRPSATTLAQAGVDLATLAAILGRSSIRIVQRYVHPTADPRKQAIRRFEEVLAAGEQPDGKRIP